MLGALAKVRSNWLRYWELGQLNWNYVVFYYKNQKEQNQDLYLMKTANLDGTVEH